MSVSANINNVLMIKRYTDNIDPESVSQVMDTQTGLESTISSNYPQLFVKFKLQVLISKIHK